MCAFYYDFLVLKESIGWMRTKIWKFWIPNVLEPVIEFWNTDVIHRRGLCVVGLLMIGCYMGNWLGITVSLGFLPSFSGYVVLEL